MSGESQQAIEAIISKKCFSLRDQLDFANFSGDTNPIHVDEIAARRTVNGQCIVHGMHSLLWALDSLAEAKGITAKNIQAVFLNPIFLGEEVCCVWNSQEKFLSLLSNEMVVVTINLEIVKVAPENKIKTTISRSHHEPNAPTFSECSNLSSQPFRIFGNVKLAKKLFPFFSKLYGIATACELGAMSQIVGMECPGLHSLFSSFSAIIKSSKTTPYFKVVENDERFKLLKISVQGYTMLATIGAFFRPEPSTNPHISEIAAFVKNNEFKNIHALVIGGSRGLGEVVAKIIAAGGGKTIITYNVGKDDAKIVCKEIQKWGGQCEIRQLNVSERKYSSVDMAQINQIYYFATPKIISKRNTKYDKKILNIYKDIYINSFKYLCEYIFYKKIKCSIFYPSTIFIEKPPKKFEDYVMVKLEGEKLCKSLNKKNFLDIVVERLPRFETDQNLSNFNIKIENKVNILLPLIKNLKILTLK